VYSLSVFQQNTNTNQENLILLRANSWGKLMSQTERFLVDGMSCKFFEETGPSSPARLDGWLQNNQSKFLGKIVVVLMSIAIFMFLGMVVSVCEKEITVLYIVFTSWHVCYRKGLSLLIQHQLSLTYAPGRPLCWVRLGSEPPNKL
jgi:hypothetical protein